MSGAVAHVDEFKRGLFFSEEFLGESSWNGYEHNCFFVNRGERGFLDVARAVGNDGVRDGRGAAAADLDGDGRLDLVVANNAGPPDLYLNRLEPVGRGVRVTLIGSRSNRDGIGARVTLVAGSEGGDGSVASWVQQLQAGSGYASQGPAALHFGLPPAATVSEVRVRWPSGRYERFPRAVRELAAGRRALVLEEGSGES